MAQQHTSHRSKSHNGSDKAPTKRELQRRVVKTRESVADTVGDIKKTAGEIQDKAQSEYHSARKSVAGILDYREQFQKEPVVWSLGALSAGFALGYTVGYAHKISKRDKNSPIAGFVDGVVDELSTVGQRIVMPALNENIKELFGFDFPGLLKQMDGGRRTARRTASKKAGGTKRTRTKKR